MEEILYKSKASFNFSMCQRFVGYTTMSISGLFAASLAFYIVSTFAVPIENNSDELETIWIEDRGSSQNEQDTNLLRVLTELNKAVDPCEDAYSYACKNIEKQWAPEYLQKVYPEVRNSLIKILSQKPTDKEVHSLSIEKQLFQQCMNLGANETSEAKVEKDELSDRLFTDVFRPYSTWQNIDEELSIIGFGNNFFDINVERDPENPSQNIITLKPPSHAHIKHVKHLIMKAFEPSTKNNQISRIVNRINIETRNSILNFLKILYPMAFFTTTEPGHVEKVNLNNLNSMEVYDEFDSNVLSNKSDSLIHHFPEFKDFLKNHESSDKNNNKVDLVHAIKQRFATITDINDDEVILIKHKPYFLLLNKLLNAFSNDAIVTVMRLKVLIENLRYIEWKSANSLEHIKRSIFCFGDTKLYGASYRLNRDLRKDEHKQGEYYQLVQRMLHEIVDVINTEIVNSKTISSEEKAFLVSEIKLITANALHQNRKYVSEYYTYNGENFKFRSSYFHNIIRYKQLIQNIELKKLRDASKHNKPEPFSITDLDRPSNRFVFNLFVSSNYSPLSSDLPKEIHYAVYGAKIASFLFGLFNEQRGVDAQRMRHRDDWSVHPVYSNAVIDCFTSNLVPHNKELSSETLTELFGLRIAYKAMLMEYVKEGSRKYFGSEVAPESMTSDQMFFLTYAKYNCYQGKSLINTVLSNIDAFSYSYRCYEEITNDLPKCHLKGFEIQEKSLLRTA